MEKNTAHEDNHKMELAEYSQVSSRKWTQYVAAGLATISTVCIGTHLSWSSAAIPMLKASVDSQRITDYEGSWIISIITLGACVGAIATGPITNKIGPKRTLQVAALPLLVPWYIITFSQNIWSLYIGRMIAGIGVGAACVAAPIYITEIGESKIRGTLGTFFQLQMTIGFLLGYVLGGTIDNFKVLALSSSAVPVIFLLTYSFMPESPLFLRLNSKTDNARKSLRFFRGRNYDVDSELSGILENQPAANNNGKFSDLYTNKATLKAMIIALALMFFQQLSGVNAVLFNAVTIFQLSGSSLHPNVCTIICGVLQVGATYGAIVLIDRLGRKILLIISGGVMSLCLMILGAYFYMYQLGYDLNNFYFVPLICIAVYLIVFSIGLGPIPWMIAGDIFSPQVKGLACSISAAFNWILAFMVTKFFNSLQDLVGTGLTFVLFAIICIFSVVFTIFVIPETKGKTIQEVQVLLSSQPVNTYVANDE